jgi:putative membrane protein
MLLFIKEPLTYFAAERTLLVWVRTGATLIGLGFIIDRFGLFLRMTAANTQAISAFHQGFSFWFGAGFVLLGAIVNGWAAVRYWRFQRRFERGDTSSGKGVLAAVGLAIILAAAGAALAVYLSIVYH